MLISIEYNEMAEIRRGLEKQHLVKKRNKAVKQLDFIRLNICKIAI